MLEDIFKTGSRHGFHSGERSLYRKTKGNPFYIKQFLRLCHPKGYLKLDMDTGSWSGKEAEIRACPAQENVVDFLTENLNQFSEETISILSFGACIGQSFSVEDLSAVCGLTEREINRRLITAVAQEAVYPMEKDGKTGLQTMYQFTRPVSSRCSILPLFEKARAGVHYLLGTRYEERSRAAGDLDERAFEIADHYAKGLGEATDQKNGAGFRSSCWLRRTGAAWYPPSTRRAVPEPPALQPG